MVNEIVQDAIARKMLCKPVNSLIGDTEFCMAVGMALRFFEEPEAALSEAGNIPYVDKLQEWFLTKYADRYSKEFDTTVKNLLEMMKEYRPEAASITSRLKALMVLGYERELVYPKGRF